MGYSPGSIAAPVTDLPVPPRIAVAAGRTQPAEHAGTPLDYGAFPRRYGHPARAPPCLPKGSTWPKPLSRLAGRTSPRGAAHSWRATQARCTRAHRPKKGGWQRWPSAGPANAQIARQLSVPVSAVGTHLERICAKLGIRSRHELIAIIAARGGIPPDAGTTDIRSALPRPASARKS